MEAPARAPQPARKGLETFGDVLAEYERVVLPTHRSGATEADLLRSLSRHWITGVRCEELQSWHLAAYRDDRLREVKANSIQRVFNLIRPMLETARIEWNCPIQGNPAREVKIRRTDDSRSGRLCPEQMAAFLASVRRRRNPEVISAIELALETTMRRSELLAADWKDVDLAGRLLLVPTSKNGEARVVALTPRAVEILEGLPRRTGPILRCTHSAIRSAMNKATKQAGVEGFCFHKLRHEGISRLWDLGLNEIEISSMSGHKDWKMLRRYSHVQAQSLVKKLESSAGRDQLPDCHPNATME